MQLRNRNPLMPTPHPKNTTGRPIVQLLELLGRRWTLRFLWELRTGEPVTVVASKASLDGADLGEIGDFWTPQRGMFRLGRAFFWMSSKNRGD
jgi:hypothetical protein